jgi:hypothetical protein
MLSRRITAAVAVLGATGALIGLSAAGVGARTRAGQADSGTAYASINRSAGGYEYVSATNTDKLFGASAVTSKSTLTHQTGATFKLSSKHTVLWTKTGSLEGTESATVTVSGTTETFTNGKLDLTNGTGSLSGHSFVGTFTGSGSSSSNEFTLNYKGTYK